MKHFRKHPGAVDARFLSDKVGALSIEKLHNRYSPGRSRIQSRYLSIVKYASWQLLLISVYKTYTNNKNSTNITGAVTAMLVLYFGLQ